MKNFAKGFYVMTINDVSVPAERLHPLLVDVHLMLQRGRLRLTKAVDVKDGHQVVQFVVGAEVEGLPNGTLGALSITNQTEGAVAENARCSLLKLRHKQNSLDFVNVFANIRHTSSTAETLAQRSSGHVNKRQTLKKENKSFKILTILTRTHRSWMTFKVAVDLTQVHQIFNGEEASLRPSSIQDGSSVALWEEDIYDRLLQVLILTFDMTNRSFAASLGALTLYFMVLKNSTDMISAADAHDVG